MAVSELIGRTIKTYTGVQMLLGPCIGNLRGLNKQLTGYAFWAVCLESDPENGWQINSKVQEESNGTYDNADDPATNPEPIAYMARYVLFGKYKTEKKPDLRPTY